MEQWGKAKKFLKWKGGYPLKVISKFQFKIGINKKIFSSLQLFDLYFQWEKLNSWTSHNFKVHSYSITLKKKKD